jgi:hypothetical protein
MLRLFIIQIHTNSLDRLVALVTPKPNNKILVYLLLTALMVVTFICALAIQTNTYSTLAWLILLATNLGILIYILRSGP